MAVCNWCEQEMNGTGVASCSANTTVDYPGGESLPSCPWNGVWDRSTASFGTIPIPPAPAPEPGTPLRRCRDCNVAPGGFHHPGCDVERCPKCGGQLISCGCLDEEDEE
jgi:hypothetical protein